jgi:putative transposase
VLDALSLATTQRRPQGVIHHSGHGCQYTALAFGQRCQEMGVRPSPGTVGDAYDNAMAGQRPPITFEHATSHAA